MIKVTGYDISSYGEMVDCEPRMSVFAQALKRAITPGCTVIDLGASFGPFALLACKYGAGKVIAIEPDPSVELIMPMAQANSCADRITVVKDLSTNYRPDAKADVIISDVRGTMPLFETHIPTIVDARERLLKEGGHQLPMRDTIRIALARSPKTYRPCYNPWVSNKYGIDLSLGRPYVVNSYQRVDFGVRHLISEPRDLAVIDYREVTDPDLDSTVELIAERDTVAHGLLMWFDAEIADGLTYSNAPGQPPLVYSQMFLPMAEPLKLRAGDIVKARIRAKFMGRAYIWSWDCDVIDNETGSVVKSFRQSTFKGDVISKSALDQISDATILPRSTQIEIDRDCLSFVGEGRSVDEIAALLLKGHPDHFKTHMDALSHATGLLGRYVDSNS